MATEYFLYPEIVVLHPAKLFQHRKSMTGWAEAVLGRRKIKIIKIVSLNSIDSRVERSSLVSPRLS